jgi:hypothetical protein
MPKERGCPARTPCPLAPLVVAGVPPAAHFHGVQIVAGRPGFPWLHRPAPVLCSSSAHLAPASISGTRGPLIDDLLILGAPLRTPLMATVLLALLGAFHRPTDGLPGEHPSSVSRRKPYSSYASAASGRVARQQERRRGARVCPLRRLPGRPARRPRPDPRDRPVRAARSRQPVAKIVRPAARRRGMMRRHGAGARRDADIQVRCRAEAIGNHKRRCV